MRDIKARSPAPVRPLDEVSDHMGQILRHADELLAEWSKLGAQVRSQIDRETQQIGSAVANAVDDAVARSVATTAANVDRAVTQAMAERVGTQLQQLTAELSRLEARAKAASRQITDQRTGDRKVLWVIAGGIVLANVLLALVLLRKPTAPEIAPQATPVVSAPPAEPKPPEPALAVGSDRGSAIPDEAPPKDVVKDPSDTTPAVGSDAMRGAHGAPSRKR